MIELCTFELNQRQEIIQVGCVLPACLPYLIVFHVRGEYLLPGHTHPLTIPYPPSEGTWYKRYPQLGRYMGSEITNPPLVDRMTDRRLWKHYLPPTSLADGNNWCARKPTINCTSEFFPLCCWGDVHTYGTLDLLFDVVYVFVLHPVGGFADVIISPTKEVYLSVMSEN